MPTLFRLIITLLFLVGLAYAGMFALVAFVEPTPKPVSQRLPARVLLGEEEAARAAMPDPLVESRPADGTSP